jgi:flagellar hook-basal body complex protein FliE
MPTISEIHERVLNSARIVDESTGTGGTTSDPTLVVSATSEVPVTEVTVSAPDVPEVREKAKEKPDPMAAKFGALARREKELRAQDQAATRRIQEMEQREKLIKEREERLLAAKSNPLKILKEHGFSYQDATEAVLGNYKEPEPDPFDVKLKPYADKFEQSESKIAKLEAELAEFRTQASTKQYQEGLNQAIKDINATLSDDKYEITRAMGNDGVDFVRDIMVEYYKANERLLDYTEACQIAEDYYEKEYLAKLLDTKKVKARLPVSAPQAKTPAKQAKATLTNDLATGGGAMKDIDTMSKDEAIAYLSKKLQYGQ